MKKHFYIAFLVVLNPLFVLPQQTITLTFTAIDSASYVQLDSIKVRNSTQDCDTVLYWNDTVLVLNVPVGLPELHSRTDGFEILCFPNPVTDHASIELALPESGETVLTVTDVLGRVLYILARDLQTGTHTFDFIPGNDPLYLITATWNGYRKSIKVLNSSQNKAQQCMISYQGHDDLIAQEKAAEAMQDFTFELGDELQYIGYIDTLESGLMDVPDSSQTYTFQFAYNFPCPGIPTVTYKGQVYNTAQIFGQCWLKENLNVGTQIIGDSSMADNGIIEKYCYGNEQDKCDKYGGLYLRGEMMNYSSQPGSQGICPPGWHVPTDQDWLILEGTVDSKFKIGSYEWINPYGALNRGFDCGKNLRDSTTWSEETGQNIFGFSALAAGRRRPMVSGGFFNVLGYYTYCWTSSPFEDKPLNDTFIYRGISSLFDGMSRLEAYTNSLGLSVRCIKDRTPTSGYIELSFTAIDSTTFIPLDSIKIMNHTQGGDTILYYPDTIVQLTYPLSTTQRSSKQVNGFMYDLGDELLLIGYVDTLESGIVDTPMYHKSYTFQFAYNIPCPGTPTVTYEGKVYNTVQIFSQCWLKENLNVGTMIPGDSNMSDNGIIEKYCYNDKADSCSKYGGLYLWNELMQYNTVQGSRGICPPGWHIPTDDEWKVLEGAVDSQYGIGDGIWELEAFRGFDAGKHLKSASCWNSGGNGLDTYGFKSLPGGFRFHIGNFLALGNGAYYHTSTENVYWPGSVWARMLYFSRDKTDRSFSFMDNGSSVRCVRD